LSLLWLMGPTNKNEKLGHHLINKNWHIDIRYDECIFFSVQIYKLILRSTSTA
jgi:hypothetical protein